MITLKDKWTNLPEYITMKESFQLLIKDNTYRVIETDMVRVEEGYLLFQKFEDYRTKERIEINFLYNRENRNLLNYYSIEELRKIKIENLL
jgi:hypothetical protein